MDPSPGRAAPGAAWCVLLALLLACPGGPGAAVG